MAKASGAPSNLALEGEKTSMPVNSHLLQRLTGIQQSLMAQHVAGRGLPHSSVGSERETFLREFLQKVFPAHRRFATGAITDSEGRLSGQVDVAVEYGFIPSFPTPGTDERLLLAESVALALEIKSDITSQWSQVRETTSKIKLLKRYMNVMYGDSDYGLPSCIPCIAVGYKGHSTLEGLQQRLHETPEDQRPDGALVIESGCFVGFGMDTTGPLGLYALCMVIDMLFAKIGFAAPDLGAYIRA